MTGQDALTVLVQAHVGAGRRWSVRAFAERAVDPETGYSPGKSLIGKIIAGQGYTVSPSLVRALAAGLEVPLGTVQAAAAAQFVGVVISEVDSGGATIRVAHDPEADLEAAPLLQAFINAKLGRGTSSDPT
jgi:hypothetical protein